MSHDSSSFAVVSFSCQSTVYFWFLFQGNNTNIRNFNVYGKNNPIPGKFFAYEVS